VLGLSGSGVVENFARIVSYCRTSRRKAQIMREMNFNDLETDAYTTILVRQSLLEEDFGEYRTTEKGRSYLDTRSRVKIAIGNSH
jgi:predicted transcriptional regulator